MLFVNTYIAMETIRLLEFELFVYECIPMRKYMLAYLAQPEKNVVFYFHFLT